MRLKDKHKMVKGISFQSFTLRWNEFDFQKSNKEMVIKKSFFGTNVSIECSMYLNEKSYLVFYFLVPGISNQVRSN